MISGIDLLYTSNIVERLFSQAKYIMTDHRKKMNPDHLNELLILKYHKIHWNAGVVEACINGDDEIVEPIEENNA
jgi:hypothetical protein